MNNAIKCLEEREILLRSWLPTYHEEVAKLMKDGRSAEEIKDAEDQIARSHKAISEITEALGILKSKLTE